MKNKIVAPKSLKTPAPLTAVLMKLHGTIWPSAENKEIVLEEDDGKGLKVGVG